MTDKEFESVMNTLRKESPLFRAVIAELKKQADTFQADTLHEKMVLAAEMAYNTPDKIKNHVCWTQNLKFFNKNKRYIQAFLRDNKIDLSTKDWYNKEDPFFSGATNVNHTVWLVFSLVAATILDNLSNAEFGA